MILSDLIDPGIPVAEKVIRTIAVYVGMLILLRLGGRRGLAQLNSFDLVVLLLLANVVQNAVIGNDTSLSGGLLGAAVLIGANALLERISSRSPLLIRLLEGTPKTVVAHGEVVPGVLRRLGMSRADLAAALRHQGADDVAEVQEAVFGPGGSIVVSIDPELRDATRADLERATAAMRSDLTAQLGAMEERLAARPGSGPSQGGK